MTAPVRILVVEDDDGIRRGLVDALRFGSFHVDEAATAKAAHELALSIDCDLVLLDLRLPGGDGLDILRKIRGARPMLPVIILTARGDEADRVRGLKLGADDYVVKPFSILELIARVRAVLRRSPSRQVDVAAVEFPLVGTVVDLHRREIRRGDSTMELTPGEADLFRYLAGNGDRAISREELLGSVWRIEAKRNETRTVDMCIARLREKLGEMGGSMILTVRGKGYMLSGEAIVKRDVNQAEEPA